MIRAIALETWPVAYGSILSPQQLSYMLGLMYSEAALRGQMTEGHRFVLLLHAGRATGFAGYEQRYGGRRCTRLHKLYVLPSEQGTGAGRALLEHVAAEAANAGDITMELNVNRFNKARMFYEKHGFRVVRDEVIDIGHGFVMDDHVMERAIGPH
ncbi:MAG: GNAT family N-acetyltransferase [Flavobacteriales bacterium]|nr:GNAT family N-acetyltransferase [Flavobacteriales bacterium]